MDRESNWSVISAIATVISLFIPFIILYFSSRATKELTVETVSISVPVDLSDPRLSSLKLTYKNVSVDRLTVATIEVNNTGSQPIEQKDFERPVTLRFQNPADVLAATLSGKHPDDLHPTITTDSNGISITPLLLNPGDKFRITVQTRGIFTEPKIEARISGLSSIIRQTPHEPLFKKGYFQLILGIVGVIAYAQLASFVWVALRNRRSYTLLPLPESILMVVMILSTGTVCGVTGLVTLEIHRADIISWKAFTVLALVIFTIMPLAMRRARRLFVETYKWH